MPGQYAEYTTMDGRVKYTGSATDRDLLLADMGNTAPNIVRVEELP